MARQGTVKVEVTVLPALVQVLRAERDALALALALARGASEGQRLLFLAEQQELINAMERRVSRVRRQRDQLRQQLRAQKEDPMTTPTTPTAPTAPEYKRCPTCKELDALARHRCAPAWLVWEEREDEATARTIYAPWPDAAAERWAKEEDRLHCNEIVNGDSTVVVVKAADGALTRWRVSGEFVPEYSASAALSPPPENVTN